MKGILGKASKLLAVLLAVVFVVTLMDFVPASAADKEFKVVYTVKQLKKAMKAKSAGSIVFRTETYDDITIPSVKAAKNKAIYIDAPHSDVKNKSKFSNVEIIEVSSFTETVSGNTIVWNSNNYEGLTVAKGKTVNKLVYKKFQGLEPTYTLRKGAKVKSLSLIGEGTESKENTKKRTVTVETVDPYSEYINIGAVVTYTLDKSGRIIASELKNLVDDITYTYKHKYDKNGNLIESEYNDSADVSSLTVCKYDSKNNIVEYALLGQNNSDYNYKVFYEYDSNGRTTHAYSSTDDGSPDPYDTVYVYDKKGRCIKTDCPNVDYNVTYKYDSDGRLTEMVVWDGSYDLTQSSTYKYDKNGLLIESIENYGGVSGYSQEFSYDYLGNQIFMVNKYLDEDGYASNESRYEFYTNEFVGGAHRFEDGFVSPVGDEPYDMEAYVEKGYTVVQSTEQFLEAIAPGAKIIIPPCYVNMSEFLENAGTYTSEYVSIEDNYVDGKQLVIYGCDDLIISGSPSMYYGNSSELVVDPRYSAVIRFEDCNNLKLSALTLGHTSTGGCEGNVLDFKNCKDVSLYGVDLYGCGVYGIGTSGTTKNINVYNSIIRYCSGGIFEIRSQSGAINFTNCLFYGSDGGGYASGLFDGTITFKKCSFGENETNTLYFNDDMKFEDCLWSEVTRYPEYPDY